MKPLTYIILLLLFSCADKNKVPSDITKPLEMQKILWDLAKAQALATEIAHKDSLINEIAETKILTQKVFALHHITNEKFNETYNWYTNHPDVLKNILDSMGVQNQREIEQAIRRKTVPVKFDPKKMKRKL